MAFVFEKQNIQGLVLIKPENHIDERGSFLEFYKKSEFKKNEIQDDFCQDNFSYSKKNTLRGLHFQKSPHSQSKLITCLKGSILDVTLDLRKNSKTYKKSFKTILSELNHHFLYIPEGFAHGFIAIEDSVVLYKTSKEYSIESDCGVSFFDEELNLGIDFDFSKIIISNKDQNLPKLKDIEVLL